MITMIEEGDVYGMKAPNGADIEAYALCEVSHSLKYNEWLMYSQNRLFTLLEIKLSKGIVYDWVNNVCDYCVIPKADKVMKDCNEFAAYPIVKIENIRYAV